jgi:hypothetical protein
VPGLDEQGCEASERGPEPRPSPPRRSVQDTRGVYKPQKIKENTASGCGGPDGVNLSHGVHEAAARRRPARGNHVQRAFLAASARASRRAIPNGRRRDRDRFDRADRVSRRYSRAGTRVGLSGRAGSAEGSEARSKREDLFGAVPLRAAAGKPVGKRKTS